MKSIVVYTAIFGSRDVLIDPEYVNNGFEYVCFTDNKELKSKIWSIRYCSPVFKDPVMSAKLFKLLPQNLFPDFETSIWIDGNMVIISDLSPLKKVVDSVYTLACFNHNLSIDDSVNCIYDEAKILLKEIKNGKHQTLDPKPIRQHIKKLLKEGYPHQFGLISGNLLIRKHMDKKCIAMMEKWWFEILCGSRRDELSFNYLSWKTNFLFHYVEGDFKKNNYFITLKHLK